jgi:hypothetical protein
MNLLSETYKNRLTELAGLNVEDNIITEKQSCILKEQTDNPFTDVNESKIDSKSCTIKDVCVFGSRLSKNGRIYSDKAIESLANFTNGAKCFINHPTSKELKERDGVRDLRDWVGVYRNPKRDGERVTAELVCRESYFGLVKDIASLQPMSVGNSINARVKMYKTDDGMESVVDLDKLHSVDLVSNAATTTSLFEAALKDNVDDEDEIKKFASQQIIDNHLAKEGMLADQIEDQEKKRKVSDLTWAANDMLYDIMWGNKDEYKNLTMDEKKTRITSVLDDLDVEIKKVMNDTKMEAKTEMKDITLDALKAERADLIEAIKKELEEAGKVDLVKTENEDNKKKVTELTEAITAKDNVIKEKDEKIVAMETENKTLKEELDKYQVAEKLNEKKAKINALVEEAKLPKEAITDVFMESLMSLDAEEAIKKQIEDRKNILNIKTGKITGAGDEFVFEADTKKAEVTESDVDDFVKKLK